MAHAPTFIKTPRHVHPGVRTERDYRANQAEYLARLRRSYAHLSDATPRVSESTSAVFVSGGKWLVECSCGNCPSVEPTWRLALCYECGAVYENVAMPSDWRAIEAALVVRGALSDRYWTPAETVADLEDQNEAAGSTRRREETA